MPFDLRKRLTDRSDPQFNYISLDSYTQQGPPRLNNAPRQPRAAPSSQDRNNAPRQLHAAPSSQPSRSTAIALHGGRRMPAGAPGPDAGPGAPHAGPLCHLFNGLGYLGNMVPLPCPPPPPLPAGPQRPSEARGASVCAAAAAVDNLS